MAIDVADLGEFALIDRITARLPRGAAGVLVGPGDDAAVLAAPDGRVVATTDLLVAGRHFRAGWSTGYDVGRRAAAANLADIAAMGAVPTALLVGLAVPAGTEVAWVEALADGLRDEAAAAGAAVVGGDVTATDRLTVAVTALGDLRGAPPVLRSTARPGDVVVVAGRLGWAAVGLAVLRRADAALAARFAPFVAAFARPDPPYAAGPALAAAGATSLIDVSDGLAADLGHVATASGVRIEVSLASLHTELVSPALADALAAVGDPALVWTGGDDHALAGTVPAGAVGAARAGGAVVVGRVVTGSGVVDADTGRPLTGGHEHFRGEAPAERPA